MPQNGPIAIAAVAGHSIALAHYFSGGCCQCPMVGPLHWQELLPMGSLWPIMFLADAGNGFAWANLFFRRYFQCPSVGPFQEQQLPPKASLWPIIPPAAVANTLRWADRISSSSSSPWLCFGPLLFRQLLLMP